MKISDRSANIDLMPRPSNPEVRRRLLAAGLDLVHARGFAASGVKDITDAAGVPKGSFYAYFPSKEASAAAILEHYWADIEMRLLPILDADGLAQERITRFFHALADEPRPAISCSAAWSAICRSSLAVRVNRCAPSSSEFSSAGTRLSLSVCVPARLAPVTSERTSTRRSSPPGSSRRGRARPFAER
jgi:AcrR family transcriptional regulator